MIFLPSHKGPVCWVCIVMFTLLGACLGVVGGTLLAYISQDHPAGAPQAVAKREQPRFNWTDCPLRAGETLQEWEVRYETDFQPQRGYCVIRELAKPLGPNQTIIDLSRYEQLVREEKEVKRLRAKIRGDNLVLGMAGKQLEKSTALLHRCRCDAGDNSGPTLKPEDKLPIGSSNLVPDCKKDEYRSLDGRCLHNQTGEQHPAGDGCNVSTCMDDSCRMSITTAMACVHGDDPATLTQH
jgi:hypothetical protein